MTMKRHRRCVAGFSLIEMMIVIAVLTIVMGAIFAQIISSQARASVEQAKLDLFQESREFMDQMTRDLHNAGYPNIRNFGWDPTADFQIATPQVQNPANAVGLVKVDNGDLWFEGDVIGDGNVYSVRYHLEPTGANCPCLQRSWQRKVAGDPLAQPYDYQVEVQNVLNGSANYTLSDHPIFSAYYDTDTEHPVTLPIDANNTYIGSINTIKVALTVQAKIKDPTTRLAPTVTMMSTVKLNNCNFNNTGDSGSVGCGALGAR